MKGIRDENLKLDGANNQEVEGALRAKKKSPSDIIKPKNKIPTA